MCGLKMEEELSEPFLDMCSMAQGMGQGKIIHDWAYSAGMI